MQCPNCEFEPSSVQGWKRHMTMTHGGWSSDQLARANGLNIFMEDQPVNGSSSGVMTDTEGSHLMGEDSFDSFASKLPSDASSGFDAAQTASTGAYPEAGETVDATDTPAARRMQMPKKMRAEMRKLKKKIAEELPELFFNRRAEQLDQPEWKLTTDEKDAISDSINMVLEVLDIEFAIEPLSMTLTSIWWVIAYPIVVILGIFMLKQSEIMKKENPLGEDTEAQSTQVN